MARDDTDDIPEETGETGEPDVVDGATATAVADVDQRIVDLLSWILDTETRAKIYVYLLANPASTSEEVATGTGLYPSTVREALAELHEEDRLSREKRASEGAGNNPYEYTAIQPSELVGGVVDQVQRELNTIFTLDRVLERDADPVVGEDVEPVTITVNDAGTLEVNEQTEMDAEESSAVETRVDESTNDTRVDESTDDEPDR